MKRVFKSALIILLITMLQPLSAQQFHDYAITNHVGIGVDKERGATYIFDLEIKKHLGLGIYGVGTYGAGNSGKNSSSSLNRSKVSFLDLSQFTWIGLGLSKSVQLADKGRMNLGVIAHRVKEHRFQLKDLVFDGTGQID